MADREHTESFSYDPPYTSYSLCTQWADWLSITMHFYIEKESNNCTNSTGCQVKFNYTSASHDKKTAPEGGVLKGGYYMVTQCTFSTSLNACIKDCFGKAPAAI